MTYSSSLALNRSRLARTNQNTVVYRTQARVLGPVSNTIILIVLACLLGLLYLTQVTKTNAYGYQISGMQQTASQLKSQYSDLQNTSARLQSLGRVQSSAVAKNLVPVTPAATVSDASSN